MSGAQQIKTLKRAPSEPVNPCLGGHVPFILDADLDETTLVCMRCTADLTIVTPPPEIPQKQLDAESGRIRCSGYLEG